MITINMKAVVSLYNNKMPLRVDDSGDDNMTLIVVCVGHLKVANCIFQVLLSWKQIDYVDKMMKFYKETNWVELNWIESNCKD